jgi:hypothetical protein
VGTIKILKYYTSSLDLNLGKNVVKCYIWSIAFYVTETWALQKGDQKYLESFEMWCRRRMEKIIWTNRVRNEEVLLRVNEQRNILHNVTRRKADCSGYILCRKCFLEHVIKGNIGRTGRRDRRCKQLLNYLKKSRRYCRLKTKALDYIL